MKTFVALFLLCLATALALPAPDAAPEAAPEAGPEADPHMVLAASPYSPLVYSSPWVYSYPLVYSSPYSVYSPLVYTAGAWPRTFAQVSDKGTTHITY